MPGDKGVSQELLVVLTRLAATMMNAPFRSVIRVSAVPAILLAFGISAFGADQRPNVIAPDRYLTPLPRPVDTVEQQGAYAYRNELLAEQRRVELSPTERPGATELRRAGEINREINRIDRLLQQ